MCNWISRNILLIIVFWLAAFGGCVSSQVNNEENQIVTKLQNIEKKACSCTNATCAETALGSFSLYVAELRENDICVSDEIADRIGKSSARTTQCLLNNGIDPERIRREIIKDKDNSSHVSVSAYDHGIYEINNSTNKSISVSSDGKKFACNCSLIRKTDEIPLSLGTKFGIRFFIKGKCDTSLSVKIKHPRMVNPENNSESYQVQGIIKRIPNAIQYIGYNFDYKYEMVPGEWVFELWHEDAMLFQKKFYVKE